MPRPLGGNGHTGLMSIDQQTIEKIVTAAVEKHFATGTVAARPVDSAVAIPEKAQGVSLIEPVITADVLQQHVNGSRSFRIGKNSLLTPTAHDYIRTHGLTWSRATAATSNNVATWLALVVKSAPHVTGALDQLTATWRQELLSTAGEAARRAVSAISRAEADGVVIITDNPQAAACLGNRSPNIRAAAVTDANDLDAAIKAIGVNLVTIDPTRIGGFQLRQLLRRFSEAGRPQPPVNWETLSRLW